MVDYASTKGPIVFFTRSMAQALADKTVRVNAVEPGPVWTLPAKSPRRRVDGLAPGEIWLSLVSAPRTISFLCSCKVDDKLLRPNLDARNVTADEAAIVDRCRQLETLPNRSDDERPRSRLPGTELTLPTRSGWPWRRSLPGRLWRAATTDAPPRATGRRGRISKQPSRPMRRLVPVLEFRRAEVRAIGLEYVGGEFPYLIGQFDVRDVLKVAFRFAHLIG